MVPIFFAEKELNATQVAMRRPYGHAATHNRFGAYARKVVDEHVWIVNLISSNPQSRSRKLVRLTKSLEIWTAIYLRVEHLQYRGASESYLGTCLILRGF